MHPLESAKNVLELEERTRRIDKIVDAIVMVTVQTKMLAVNGNVEAARAGEYGRGFSVVAGDIRSLANESSENADKIKDLVKNVQTQIIKVAERYRSGGQQGAAGSGEGQGSTSEPRSDRQGLRLIVAGIKEVSKGSVESLPLEQAGKASQQIASAAEETGRASTEGAGASEQGLKAAQEIAQAIEDIASQADELQNG